MASATAGKKKQQKQGKPAIPPGLGGAQRAAKLRVFLSIGMTVVIGVAVAIVSMVSMKSARKKSESARRRSVELQQLGRVLVQIKKERHVKRAYQDRAAAPPDAFSALAKSVPRTARQLAHALRQGLVAAGWAPIGEPLVGKIERKRGRPAIFAFDVEIAKPGCYAVSTVAGVSHGLIEVAFVPDKKGSKPVARVEFTETFGVVRGCVKTAGKYRLFVRYSKQPPRLGLPLLVLLHHRAWVDPPKRGFQAQLLVLSEVEKILVKHSFAAVTPIKDVDGRDPSEEEGNQVRLAKNRCYLAVGVALPWLRKLEIMITVDESEQRGTSPDAKDTRVAYKAFCTNHRDATAQLAVPDNAGAVLIRIYHQKS